MNEKKPKNATQLTLLVQQELLLSEKQSMERILKLQNQGKISFENAHPPSCASLTTYLKTSQAIWYWLTVITATLASAIIFVIPEELHPWSYVQAALGLVFVSWLPGYTFARVLFPVSNTVQESSENLDNIERIGLSIGVSVALVPLVALILNYTPWGISMEPIFISLFVLTVFFATVAVKREQQAKFRTQT